MKIWLSLNPEGQTRYDLSCLHLAPLCCKRFYTLHRERVPIQARFSPLGPSKPASLSDHINASSAAWSHHSRPLSVCRGSNPSKESSCKFWASSAAPHAFPKNRQSLVLTFEISSRPRSCSGSSLRSHCKRAHLCFAIVLTLQCSFQTSPDF